MEQFSELQQCKEKSDDLPSATVAEGWYPNLTLLCGEKNVRRSNFIVGFVFFDNMKLAFDTVEALKDFLWFLSGDIPDLRFFVLFCQIILP